MFELLLDILIIYILLNVFVGAIYLVYFLVEMIIIFICRDTELSDI